MTEGSAVSAFDLTSARPDTAHQQVGGSPGLPGTRNGCMLGLNRRPIWWILAWGPQYLGWVSIILAKLAARDPGGRYRNRPKNSLRQIFLLWHPQTFTPLDRRLHVLDRLRKIEPDSAWE